MKLSLFGSKLTEPFINKQTHTCIQHLANYSKIHGLSSFGIKFFRLFLILGLLNFISSSDYMFMNEV